MHEYATLEHVEVKLEICPFSACEEEILNAIVSVVQDERKDSG